MRRTFGAVTFPSRWVHGVNDEAKRRGLLYPGGKDDLAAVIVLGPRNAARLNLVK